MKKNVKAIFAGLAAAALLAGFSSCSNGSSDDSLNKPAGSSTGANQTDTNNDEVFSGDEISFVANVASYDSKDSVLIIKYDRTAEGSDDAISLTNVKLNVTVNAETIETPSTINFELDPYSSFDKSYNYKSEETAEKQHDYKYKFNLGKKINVNDVVKVQLVSAKVTGAGASRVKLGSLTVSLIDVSQYATVKAYYTELCAENYKCLITKKNGADLNATVAVEEPANPTPANNTPENPAPANPTPENPTPANNTSTPAATTPTAPTITYSESVLSAIQKGDNIWGSGTNVSEGDAPYTVTSGTGWDSNGMASIPFCTGSLDGFNYILVEIDTTQFSFRDDFTDPETGKECPSFELKIEKSAVKDETTQEVITPGKEKIINGTRTCVEGIYYIPISSCDFISEMNQFCLNLRGTGTLILKNVKKAKDN